MTPNYSPVARLLEELCRDLPETISRDDLVRHDDLRRIILAADDLSNRVGRRALDWAKSR